MTQPVLYLAFANTQHHPFLNLSREQQKIYNLFVANPALKGFQIHTDSFATTESLVDYLIEFKNRVSIFHYAGHADRANLVLSDDNAGRNGLTSLLGRQKHLKSTRLNSSHVKSSYAVFCLKKKTITRRSHRCIRTHSIFLITLS